MSQTGTAAAPATFAQTWANLLAWGKTEWEGFDGGVEAALAKVEPVLEADVIDALETFGEDLMGDAVSLLTGGLPTGQTISTVADNLVMKVGAQGKTILQSTAVAAAGQVVGAAQASLGAAKTTS